MKIPGKPVALKNLQLAKVTRIYATNKKVTISGFCGICGDIT